MNKSIYILLLVPFFFACENLMFEDDLESTKPSDNFEYLWNECNEKYTYFELKGIDWNEVHSRYAPQVNDSMSNEELFLVLEAMLLELKDGHTNLISDLNLSFWPINLMGQDNFNWRTITDAYIPTNYYRSGPFSHDFLHNTNNEIGYIRFASYTGEVNSTNMDFILNRYKDTKGLIVDIRENGGGAVSDVFSLLSRFVADTTLTNYSRIKNGPGINDFSDDEPVYVYPDDSITYTKKVMMLTDRGSYSASSFTALATKAIPNIVLMGDTTGGGLGLPNGGQLPNGWTYRFSITQGLTLDKDCSYENGVPPDIVALFDWSDLTKDEVIDKAVVEILK